MAGTMFFFCMRFRQFINNQPKSNLPNKKVILNIRILIVKFRLSNAQFPDIECCIRITIIKKKHTEHYNSLNLISFFDKWNIKKEFGVY